MSDSEFTVAPYGAEALAERRPTRRREPCQAIWYSVYSPCQECTAGVSPTMALKSSLAQTFVVLALYIYALAVLKYSM